MRIVYPHYYNDFVCAAGECPDTCCAGWQIVIDEESQERYEQYVGHFEKRLQEGVDWNNGCFKQDECKRCSMLNENNLCDMVLSMGEEELCDTCKLYPRHVEEYEGLREWSLSMSCPVAAHMILSCQDQVVFLEEVNEDDDPLIDEFDDFDFLLFTELEDARSVAYKILYNRELSVHARCEALAYYAGLLQSCIDEDRIGDMQEIVKQFSDYSTAELVKVLNEETEGVADDTRVRYEFLMEYFCIFNELERLRDEFDGMVDELKNLLAKGPEHYIPIREEFSDYMQDNFEWDRFRENYLMSFLYTYFCGAVYDDQVAAKVYLSVFSMIYTEEFIMCEWLRNGKKISMEECERVAYRYVREVEHSDENLNAVEEFLSKVM